VGIKTRSNYPTGLCLKEDCINRRKNVCIKCNSWYYYLGKDRDGSSQSGVIGGYKRVVGQGEERV
jgi:hypothetical protein